MDRSLPHGHPRTHVRTNARTGHQDTTPRSTVPIQVTPHDLTATPSPTATAPGLRLRPARRACPSPAQPKPSSVQLTSAHARSASALRRTQPTPPAPAQPSSPQLASPRRAPPVRTDPLPAPPRIYQTSAIASAHGRQCSPRLRSRTRRHTLQPMRPARTPASRWDPRRMIMRSTSSQGRPPTGSWPNPPLE